MNFADYNKVVEIPVRDARQLKLAQVLQVQAQGPATESEISPDLYYLGEGGTFEGKCMAAAKLPESDVVAMMRGDHGQAGESAFSCLGLNHDFNGLGPQ